MSDESLKIGTYVTTQLDFYNHLIALSGSYENWHAHSVPTEDFVLRYMNDVQTAIAALQEKGWTLAALADELGMTVNAVEKWKAGARYPANAKATLSMLGNFAKRKRIPKKRRYSNDG